MRFNPKFIAFASLFLCLLNGLYSIDLYFETDIHDPSTILLESGTYWTYGTGDGIISRYSSDLTSWHIGDPVFPIGTWPAWIDASVPGFEGHFWAPDVIEMNGKYYMYYSAFARVNGGTGFNSAIGVAVSNSLSNPDWQDLGMVVSSQTEPYSSAGEPINCIDAGVFKDANGDVWMLYGSHYGGIFMVQIDPATGMRMDNTRYPVVGNNGAWNEYEAAQVTYINGYYYMFVNLGECCAGNESTYYIVAGRSTNPTGPYLDQNGTDLWNYGGTTILSTEGNYIGPGHYGYFNNGGQNLVSIHYYDGTTADGWPARLDLLEMSFSNGWPVLTRNFTISGSTAPTPVTANLTDGGTFRIEARHSGKNLAVARARNGSCSTIADGTDINQWSASDACEEWVFNKVDDYYWSIHPANNPAQSMDLLNYSQLNGANIHTWSYHGGTAQHFRLVDLGNGYYQILARASGKVLDVENASTSDGANVYQWESIAGSYNQQFTFVSTSSSGNATTMHVESITTGTQSASRGTKRGTATVTVHNDLGNPVGSTTVTGTFSGSFNETVSGTTASDGTVLLSTSSTASGSVTVDFCVDDLTHATLTYDATQNVVTCTNGSSARKADLLQPDNAHMIAVFPNPVTASYINISIERANTVLELRDLSGRTVLSETLDEGANAIPIAEALKGLYLLNIKGEDMNYSQKLLIKN